MAEIFVKGTFSFAEVELRSYRGAIYIGIGDKLCTTTQTERKGTHMSMAVCVGRQSYFQ